MILLLELMPQVITNNVGDATKELFNTIKEGMNNIGTEVKNIFIIKNKSNF